VLAFLGLALGQEKDFVPFDYVTDKVLSGGAFTSFYYVARLCSQPAYDARVVNVSVNLPYAGWDWDSQQLVYVNVYSDAGLTQLVSSNSQGSPARPIQTWTFIYASSMGDLYTNISVGAPPSTVTFTVTFTFMEVTQDKPILPVQHRRTPAAVDFTQFREIISASKLFQVHTGPSDKPVPLLIDFSYCPGDQKTYTLVVSTVAADSESATSLYICLPDELPCTAATADRSRMDPAGLAVSTVALSTSTAEYSYLEAAVYGVGSYNGMNNFYFVVSATQTN